MKTNSKPFINGFEYSWANISLAVNGVIINGITSINYSESHEAESLYGIGNVSIARGVGNHTFEASITLQKSELIALQLAATNQGITDGDITGLLPFLVTIAYNGDQGQVPTIDILYNAQFLSNNVGTSQGDTSIEVEIPLIISHIKWGAV
jgi:hypothetical protein